VVIWDSEETPSHLPLGFDLTVVDSDLVPKGKMKKSVTFKDS